jgi:hypothetical protein
MGLYDDDKAAVTSGDVLDVIYWQAKFAALQLDYALATKQPEAPIKGLLPGVINGCNDVLTRYPQHAEVQAWKAKAEAISKKINQYPEPGEFKGNFAQWKDYSYEAGWRSYNMAKMAAAAEEWGTCKMHTNEAVTQLGRSLTRMAAWPADVQAWITASHAEMEKLDAEAAKKR